MDFAQSITLHLPRRIEIGKGAAAMVGGWVGQSARILVVAQPVTAGITSFNSQFRAAYHMMSAGSIVAAIPPVAMFFLMQRHFIAGLTLGAVK